MFSQALEKELENEKVQRDAKLSELQYELAECLSEKDFLLAEKEAETEAHEDAIKSLTRQHVRTSTTMVFDVFTTFTFALLDRLYCG